MLGSSTSGSQFRQRAARALGAGSLNIYRLSLLNAPPKKWSAFVIQVVLNHSGEIQATKRNPIIRLLSQSGCVTTFQAGLGSTLFTSRREERRPLLFDVRTNTIGALDLVLLMFRSELEVSRISCYRICGDIRNEA